MSYKIKYTEATTILVDGCELERLICDVYSCGEFSVVADQESGNHEIIQPVRKRELLPFEKRDLETFVLQGTARFLLDTLLTDLCNLGFIPEGTYVIDCTW